MPSVIHSGQRIFRSLSAIKNDLGTQAKILLPDVKEIDGLVEIGYPGRFVEGFQKQFHVTGKITVVLEGTSVTDYIQTNFRKPYHVYHQLDYANPNLKELPEDSADVITCYVGLHHFPEHTVKNFLHDVRRVLRPEGHFLLVDHDVVDKKSLHYAQGAHTIFNVMGGVSKKEEMGEIRNFQPMSYWQNLLEEVGFQSTRQSHDQVLIRQGDPSRNRMMCFVNGGRRLSLSNGMGL
jgi:SAM-dependent methyltransferase